MGMTVDSRLPAAAMVQFTAEVEQAFEEQGWDVASMLSALRIQDANHVAITEINVDLIGENIDQAMWHLAVHLSRHPETVDEFHERYPGSFALAVNFEAWGPPPDFDPERDVVPPFGFADMIGAREFRLVVVVDQWGRLFSAGRVRGEQQLAGEVSWTDRGGAGITEHMLAVLAIKLFGDRPLCASALRGLTATVKAFTTRMLYEGFGDVVIPE